MSRPLVGRMRLFRQAVVGRNQSGFITSLQGVLANVLVLVLNVLTGVITARLLGPSDKGVQAAIILWPGILISFANVGLHTALLYHIKKTEKSTGAFLSAAIVIGALTSGLAIIVGVAVVPHSLSNYSSEAVRISQLYMVFLPIAVLSNVYGSVTQARGDFRTYNGLLLLQPLVTLIVISCLVATGELTAFTAAFAFLCPSSVALLWLWLRTRHLYQISLGQVGQVYRKLLSYGLRSYSGDVLAICVSQLDKLIIVSLLTPASMGFYAVAYGLAKMLVVFEAAASSVLLPKMIGQPLEETLLLLGRTARLSTLVTLITACGLMLTGPLLIRLFYGNSFRNAVSIFWILAISSVISSLAGLLGRVFYALGRPEIMALRHLVSLVVIVPAMLILGTNYGVNGVAAAVLLEATVMLMLTLSAFPTILRIPVPRLWAPQDDLAYVSALWQDWGRR